VIEGRLARRLAQTAGGPLLAVSLLACHHSPKTVRPTPQAARSAHRLQHDIDAVLAAPELQRGYWGVLVRSLDTDQTLYALNARKLLMPASNMKIVTLAAAGEVLGWDYAYETKVAACGAVDGGSLNGDLVVIGSGDPSVTESNAAATFDAWADRLKTAGVRRIAGRIIGDDNAFDHEALGMGWSWDDLQDGYATGVSALQFNENVARLTIAPGSAIGAPAVVAVSPDTSGLSIRNLLTTADEGGAVAIRTRRLPGSSIVALDGTIPSGAPPRVETVSVESPTRFFVQALRAALVDRAIEVDGPAVAVGEIKDPADLPLLESCAVVLSQRSPPLSALAATMMKTSQNLYAETLLKTLGGFDRPATIAMGRAAVETVMNGWGVAEGSLIERDGSGLSRYDYVTPEALVAILTHVDRDAKQRDAFESTLPIAGRDGTLANRMKGTAAEGRVRAKTGSMANVRALSGYATTTDGERVVFAVIANNFDVSGQRISEAMDAIVIAIARTAQRSPDL
jgi:serine-type D-Ala-D-Ala carboxypeptidase/endopeptidase (penicillin-binding protein 4)